MRQMHVQYNKKGNHTFIFKLEIYIHTCIDCLYLILMSVGFGSLERKYKFKKY